MVLKFIHNYATILFNKAFDKQLWLVMIFILGFTLRIIGTNPGYLNHPDEPKIADAALNITFHLNFEPVAFYYGSLLPIVYALMNFIFVIPIYILFYIPANFILSLLQGNSSILACIFNISFSHCALSESKGFFLYLTRYETAFLSSISIILIYYLGKKLFNKNVGLMSALFTAINYRHVLSSHFALTDAPLTVFIIVSILLGLRLIEKSSTKNYLLAGISLGAVLSVKYFIYTIPTIFLCHIIASLNNKHTLPFILKIKVLLLRSNKLVLLFGTAILFFSIINPYIFLDYKNAKEQFDLNSMFYRTSDISIQSFLNLTKIPLFSIYYLFKYGIGEILSLATILGIIISLAKYRMSTLILSSIILPFFYIFLVISGTAFVRNYSAIVPILLIFPAVFISELMLLAKSRISPFIIIILIIAFSFSSLKNSALVSYSLSQTQNQNLSLEWLANNISNDSILVNSIGAPVLSYKPATVISWTHWPTSFMSLEELIETKVQWITISSDATTFISNEFWTSKNDIIYSAFFNRNPLNEYLQNTYPNLLIQELGNYRIKEFFKPYWQSPDPSIFISKIPSLIPEAGNTIISFTFDKESDIKDWSNSSIPGKDLHEHTLSGKEKQKKMQIIQKNSCPNYPIQYSTSFTKISSRQFSISPGKWYILSANGKRDSLSKYTQIRNGFLRLDFYTPEGKRLKTYVSRQLSGDSKLEKLTAFGIAPSSSTYAKVTFQLDYCNNGEKYLLENLLVSETKTQPNISPENYPYYEKPLPENFIWLPPL